ncbi:MAG: flippase [Methanobacteriota archaeon]
MSTLKTIFKNTVFLYASEVFRKILFFFLVVYATRTLGTVSWGKISFGMAYTSMFLIVMDAGLLSIIIRDIARDKSLVQKYVKNLLLMKVFLAIITYILIVAVINALNYPPNTKFVVYIFGLVVILDAFSELFKSIYQAFERMEYVAYSRIIQAIVVVSLGVTVLFLGKGIYWYATAYFIAAFVNFLFTLFITSKYFAKIGFEIDLTLWKKLLKTGLPLLLSTVFGILYFKIDTIVLSIMKGDAIVGIYSAAYQVIVAIIFIPTLFSVIVFPVLSRFFNESKDLLFLTYKKAFTYMFILGLPISVGGFILADQLVLILYGVEYIQSIAALKVLVFVGLMVYLNYILYNTLIAIDKQIEWMYISGGSAILNVILNIVLILKMGFVGAAYATLITQVFTAAAIYYFVTKATSSLPFRSIVVKPVLAVAVMGLGVSFLRDVSIVLAVTAGAVIYFGVLVLTRAFTTDDVVMFKRIAEGVQNRVVS